ncbi:MAG: hypothetical protein K0S32_800 [Bacteroidetes bacterium]|jgi:hypothetical protein|nr:hypothetical protein [Bacteroidota bacterium]
MDGYSLTKRKENQDMLNLDKIKFWSSLVLFASCQTNEIQKNEKLLLIKSISKIGVNAYLDIQKNIEDSLNNWVKNKTPNSETETIYSYKVDSLLCINSFGNRLITCIHIFGNQHNSRSDDLIYFYGENIDANWYFFKGPCLVLPRNLYSKDTRLPLSYQQLHQIALKEIYSGYLKSDGEINEDWFTSYFEGVSWGLFEDQASEDSWLKGRRFTSKREFYEACHLEKVRSNWYGFKKDSVVSSSDKLK